MGGDYQHPLLSPGPGRRIGAAPAIATLQPNAIVEFPFLFNDTAVRQSRKVGKGKYYGAEIAASARVSGSLSLGANYTWIRRDFTDPSVPTFEPTGVPKHKAFAWAEWAPVTRLSIIPSLEIASNRWTVPPTGAAY